MAGLTPLPQTVPHTSTRLTHGEAHHLLSTFLEESQTNPAYRPDAILTQHGVQASSVGEGSNLTLNHLSRILKGIAGQRVGGVEFNYGDGRGKRRKVDARVQGAGMGMGEFTSSPPIVKDRSTQNGYSHGQEGVVGVEGVDGEDQAALVGHETGDWQDKEDYEHAQIDETVDLGGKDPAGEGIEGRNDDLGVASVPGGGRSKAEKEARKQAKKDRRKKEHQEKNRQHEKARRSSG